MYLQPAAYLDIFDVSSICTGTILYKCLVQQHQISKYSHLLSTSNFFSINLSHLYKHVHVNNIDNFLYLKMCTNNTANICGSVIGVTHFLQWTLISLHLQKNTISILWSICYQSHCAVVIICKQSEKSAQSTCKIWLDRSMDDPELTTETHQSLASLTGCFLTIILVVSNYSELPWKLTP